MAAAAVALALVAAVGARAQSEEQAAAVERSRAIVPLPPWPAGDQRGMANTLGQGTWLRCA